MLPIVWGLKRQVVITTLLLGLLFVGIEVTLGLWSFKAYLAYEQKATVARLNRNLNAAYTLYAARIEQVAAILGASQRVAAALLAKDIQPATAILQSLSIIADVHTGAIDIALLDANAKLIARDSAIPAGTPTLLAALAEKAERTQRPAMATVCKVPCYSYVAIPIAQKGTVTGSLVVGFLMVDIALSFNATSGAEVYQMPSSALAAAIRNPGSLVRHLPKAKAEFQTEVLTPSFDFPKDRVVVAIQDVSSSSRAFKRLSISLTLGGLVGVAFMLWALSARLLRPIGRLNRIIRALPLLTSPSPNQYPTALSYRHADSPSQDEIDSLHGVLVTVAATLQAAREGESAAIENATQRRVAEQLARETSAFLSSSTIAFEAERASLAREIHDELGQWLVSIHFDASIIAEMADPAHPDILARAEKIDAAIERMHAGVAALLGRLRPPALETLGLAGSLESLVQQGRAYPKAGTYLLNIQGDLTLLDNGVQVAVYRLVQESLTNVAKYAKAHLVRVLIRVMPGLNQVRLLIQDDGRGVDLAHLPAGNGLTGMQGRVAAFSGTFQVSSAPGLGMRIEITLPIQVACSILQRNQVVT